MGVKPEETVRTQRQGLHPVAFLQRAGLGVFVLFFLKGIAWLVVPALVAALAR